MFCSSHSSRSALLWPHPLDPITAPQTPLATPTVSPRPTPRSSHADLPSLAMTSGTTLNAHTSPVSSAFSIHSSSSSSIASSTAHTPTSSPPISSRPASSWPQAQPQQVRVCDSCYFAAPTPPMHTPPLIHGPNATIPAFSTRPLTLRHPRAHSGASSSMTGHDPSMPGQGPSSQSPPKQRRRDPSGSRSRSRQDSGMSASSSTFAGATSASASSTSGTGGPSTPPTSVDGSTGRRASTHSKTNMMLPRESRDRIGPDDSDEERLHSSDDDESDGNNVLTFPAPDDGDTANALSQQAQRRRRRQHHQQKSTRVVLHDDESAEPSQLLKMDKAFGSVKGAWQSWATF